MACLIRTLQPPKFDTVQYHHANNESHFLMTPVGTGVLLQKHSALTHLYVLKAG